MSAVYVSKYEISRHYGGPEEGGWWYERIAFVEPVHVIEGEARALAVCRSMNEAARKDSEREEWHMRPGEDDACDSEGRVSYFVEDELRDHEALERPHYE